TALASVAASAAALALLSLGASGDGGGANPDTGRVLAEHAATVLALSEGGKMIANGGIDPLGAGAPVTATTQPSRAVHGLPAPYFAPLRLDGGYALVEAFRSGEGLHLVYEHGPYALSVFETVGDVDFGSLPEGGKAVDIAGRRGWRQESPSVEGRLVIFELGAMAVTVAGDEPGRAVLGAARSIPEPRSLSVAQRVRRRCADVLDGLSPWG
ncbi:MAG: hypothetical protein M3R01_10355, partial [Actinomycetota bacterium]|nr:hypothetical protein [Actinomycetota bacterium]